MKKFKLIKDPPGFMAGIVFLSVSILLFISVLVSMTEYKEPEVEEIIIEEEVENIIELYDDEIENPNDNDIIRISNIDQKGYVFYHSEHLTHNHYYEVDEYNPENKEYVEALFIKIVEYWDGDRVIFAFNDPENRTITTWWLDTYDTEWEEEEIDE